ncbi:MAG: ion channel [Methyloceanibacter sp.]
MARVAVLPRFVFLVAVATAGFSRPSPIFRISQLVIPAFAFLTFYSLLVILFASAYHILSQYTADAHFYVGGVPRALSFSESIYFSIVSTVGYGDIIPHSSLARLLASLEVICGFMLLLFACRSSWNIRASIARAVAACAMRREVAARNRGSKRGAACLSMGQNDRSGASAK